MRGVFCQVGCFLYLAGSGFAAAARGLPGAACAWKAQHGEDLRWIETYIIALGSMVG